MGASRDQAVLSALPPLTVVTWDQTLPLCGSQMLHLPAGLSDTCHGGKSSSQSFGETEKGTRWTSALNVQCYINKDGGTTCLGFGAVIAFLDILIQLLQNMGFPGGSDGKKNPPAMWETWVRSLG